MQEHEQSLVEAIAKLEGASDGESGNNWLLITILLNDLEKGSK